MWIPEKIQINNLISHKDSELTFDNNLAYCIVGENLDDDCQESNGSGKSTIIEAIVFCLTGDSFRKVKSAALIRKGETQAKVSFTLENTFLSQRLNIVRALDLRGGSKVEITINNEKIAKSSVNEYNKFILETLDITRDDLLNYFIVSKEKYQSFLLSGDVKKKEIISRFSNANIVDDVMQFISEDDTKYLQEKNKLESNLQKIIGQLELLDEQLNSQQNEESFKSEIADKKIQLVDKISLEQNEVLKLKEDIAEQENLHVRLKNESIEILEQIKQIDLSELKNVIDNYELKLKRKREEIKELDNLIVQIELNLATSIECPKCAHQFSYKNEKLNIKEAKELLPTLKTQVAELNNQSQDILTLIKDQNEKLSNEKLKLSALENNKASVDSKIRQCEQCTVGMYERIAQKEKYQEELSSQIKGLDELEFNSNVDNLLEKQRSLEEEKKLLEDEIAKAINENLKFAELTNQFKRFKTHLANQSIKAIEGYVNFYLEKIKTNLSVNIEGYKLLSDGKTIRDNIVIEVLRNGEIEGLFEEFSGGEKMRIDICCILALQQLINLNSKSGGLNLLILDEIIESIDSIGVSEILKQLNLTQKSILVITHASQISNFQNIIKVQKQNKISQFV